MKKSRFTRGVNWGILLVILIFNLSYGYWKDTNRIIVNDTTQYYGYLPAVYTYHNLDMLYETSTTREVKESLWFLPSPIHKNVLKTSNGMSLLYTPFFLVSEVYAHFSSYPANGYSAPYRFGLIISSIFYLGLGLFFLRKVLLPYFSTATISITSLIIVLGTNIFSYVTKEPAMEHVYGFFMLMAFVYYTVKWHRYPGLKYSSILGALFGLIVLARPSNILIGLFFILWNITSWKDIKEKFEFYLRQYKWFILMAVLAFIVWIPQLYYWEQQTGQWFYFSYGSEERFFFGDPKILKGLFSYRKGWLLYTPIMTFALVGIFFLRKKLKGYMLPISVFLVVNVYILFSWWCWWYGGSFSQRSMIDCYGLLAIPLAAFVQYILKRNKWIKGGVLLLFTFLVFLNQFQSQQYRRSWPSIHYDAMTKEAYWANFLRYNPVPNYYLLLDSPNYADARKGIR